VLYITRLDCNFINCYICICMHNLCIYYLSYQLIGNFMLYSIMKTHVRITITIITLFFIAWTCYNHSPQKKQNSNLIPVPLHKVTRQRPQQVTNSIQSSQPQIHSKYGNTYVAIQYGHIAVNTKSF